MKYLLSIALGPVGDFIAAARRTRDLQMGSWLLSEISKAVAREISQPERLIFPNADSLDPKSAVANKLLAIVEAADDDELRSFSDRLRAVALARQRAVAKLAIKDANKLALASGALNEDRLYAQLDKFVEFYAAWIPYDERRHSDCRADVEEWATARKALRDFEPHAGQRLPKSSLDGIRETVVRKGGWLENQFHVKKNEQLDGMGLVKRFGGVKPDFDSTADVAAVPYLKKLKHCKPTELANYWRYLDDNAERIPTSASYLYRLDPDLDPGLAALIEKSQFPEPKPPYYAFFLGDGDGMGDTISKLGTKVAHQDFSKRLSKFSASVHAAAEGREGWNIVFAGGDDVMAMLPLNEALEAVVKFRECFREAMKGFVLQPTFSAGLVVAHATEPLSEVRQLAKDAEHRAKALPGKNALAITVAPRSGGETMVCDHWDPITSGLDKVVELYRNKQISAGFAYALRQLLDSTRRRGLTHLDETLGAQARTLAVRKEGGPQFLEWLAAAGSGRADLQRLCDLLLVARPFARAQREATS